MDNQYGLLYTCLNESRRWERKFSGFLLTAQLNLPTSVKLESLVMSSFAKESNLKLKLQQSVFHAHQISFSSWESKGKREIWDDVQSQVLHHQSLPVVTAIILIAQYIYAVDWIRARAVYEVIQIRNRQNSSSWKASLLKLFCKQGRVD